MENKDKPAYPLRGADNVPFLSSGIDADWIKQCQPLIGLTKRETFAMAAMQGIQISVYSSFEMYKHQLIHWQEMYGSGITVKEAMAKDAISQADEILKQLSE